jgi:pimeloyl-ACP methyl ester carboxylesterase
MPAQERRMLLDNARTMPLLFASSPPNVTCEMLRIIKMPTLVRGERTTQLFVKINEAVGQCIVGSRLVVIPKASHPMSQDNPPAFNRAVLGFLAQASTAKNSPSK